MLWLSNIFGLALLSIVNSNNVTDIENNRTETTSTIACYVCDDCDFSEELNSTRLQLQLTSYLIDDCRVNQSVPIKVDNETTWRKESVPAKYCVKMYSTSRK